MKAKQMSIGALMALFGAVGAVACGSEEGGAPPGPGVAGGDAPPGAPGEPSTPSPGSSSAPTTPGGPSSGSCTDKAKLTGDLKWTVTSSGTPRTVHVHLPPTYDPAKRTPVVLNFHGYTSDALEQAAYSGMSRKADEAGFIAVHAEGVGSQQSWNAGACCGEAMEKNVDDVAFVAHALDELEAKLCVDEKRVFATGMSNGGFLSYRLACELSPRIAAIAPVAGVMGVTSCTPTRAVPVMHFHGTYDALVPYEGVDRGGRKFPSVAATAAGWAQRNGCTGEPRTSFERGDVVCKTRDKCASGSEVTVCTVEGGGHTWPGAIPLPPAGHTTQSIRATDAMWEFFQRHPMP